MISANIKSGFRASGIYPFDPYAIPNEAVAPSTVKRKTIEVTKLKFPVSFFRRSL
jgi:hypothetical protein